MYSIYKFIIVYFNLHSSLLNFLWKKSLELLHRYHDLWILFTGNKLHIKEQRFTGTFVPLYVVYSVWFFFEVIILDLSQLRHCRNSQQSIQQLCLDSTYWDSSMTLGQCKKRMPNFSTFQWGPFIYIPIKIRQFLQQCCNTVIVAKLMLYFAMSTYDHSYTHIIYCTIFPFLAHYAMALAWGLPQGTTNYYIINYWRFDSIKV